VLARTSSNLPDPILWAIREAIEWEIQIFLCSFKHQTMKTHGGVEMYLHAVLTSALD
jgi:hypothetical protein